jgi:small subunit ribosomal protein S20
MPVTKSAGKRLRQSIKRERRNVTKRKATKSHIKAVFKAITLKDSKKAAESYKKAQSQIDRLVKKGIIHKNKAARQKSTLAKKAQIKPEEAAKNPVKKAPKPAKKSASKTTKKSSKK